ncbi:MAG: ABC transporter substrate-binding protein [Saccharofermentanales bacterium]
MKKFLMFLLVITLCFTSFGCTKKEEDVPENKAKEEDVQANSDDVEKNKDTAGESADKSDKQDSDEATRTITDSAGREVEIPNEVKTIVPLGNTPRMITYLGLAKNVVGIGECEITDNRMHAYAFVNKELWQDLPNCGTDAMGETAYYPEEIILANPDVILCTYTADVADDIQTKTGIPTVSVPQGTLFGEDYEVALRMLGDVCGVSERAEEIISYINESLEDLRTRTQDIPDDSKPAVLAAGATFKGSHSIDGVYTNYSVFETLSAKDVAVDLAGQAGSSGVMVDKEQILEWDPDMIFFDAGSMELVRTDYKENPDYFKQLKAVQNGELYQWPNSTWHWSNVEIPIVSTYYTGQLLYPDKFADVDFEEKASEVFEFFLGDPDYLSKLEEAGSGYGKVTLE